MKRLLAAAAALTTGVTLGNGMSPAAGSEVSAHGPD
jgi:hypothetical protein